MSKRAVPAEEMNVEHPLFPVEDGEQVPEIHYITIARWERGKAMTGQTFPAAEITDVQHIFDLYGGGEYILQGRRASIKYEGQPGNTVRQKKINIPGKPRPMSQNPTEEELGELPQARRIEAGGFGGGGGDGMTQVLLAMFQQQSAQAAAQQQATQAAQALAQQQAQQFMQMMVAMMQGSKSESSQMTTLMMQMSQQQSQNMMQMVTAMMANRGGGPEEMAKYAELMRTLGMGGAKGEDEKSEDVGSLVENLADIVTGIASMRGGQLPPSEPGSAASVLQAMQPK